MILARAERVTFSHGRSGRPALRNVSLEVSAGEVLVVVGPSGGGKSTLLRALGGLVPHFHGGRFAGRVVLDGLDTRTAAPRDLARVAGCLFQDPETQAIMAGVARDVAFGPQGLGVPAEGIDALVGRSLAAAGASHLRDRAIETLSGGERQRVALAGVLACGPRLVVLDEPLSQLDEEGSERLVGTIRALAEGGAAVVVAEHRLERLERIADRVLAMRDGRLGPHEPEPVPEAPGAMEPGPTVAAVEGVAAGYGACEVLAGVDLALDAGVVTILHGANGSGKSTLARVLAGLQRPTAGRVLLDGVDVTSLPAEARFPRVGLVLQDAGRRLIRERVRDELALAVRALPPAARDAVVGEALDDLGLAHLAERHPHDLSVGERERVALAAILVARPGVLVLDEPSRGMDPARKAALAALVRARAAAGAAVLVATHDVAFATAAGDRHLTLAGGRVRAPAVTAT
jgi:energy-coupling factor transporter ATP-binding protein EcfA2